MDAKTIIYNPHKAILQRWGGIDQCINNTKIINLVNDLKKNKAQIKAIKTEKQLCSKEFKNVKDDNEALGALKKQMQEISSRLKQLDECRKQQEKTLTAYFDTPAENTQPTLPSQFTVTGNSIGDTSVITVSQVGDEASTSWDGYVAQHPNASLYHRYDWRDVISRSFNHENYYFIAQKDGDIVGVLPTTRLKSHLFGDFAVSVPYFNYGGVLADNEAIANKLMTSAAECYKQLGSGHLEIRTTHKDLCPWPSTTDKVSMIRKLPATPDLLGGELGTKIRAQIKRAQQEKIETLIGSLDLLDEFYTVFARNMRDLGTPVYGKSFFSNILKQWPGLATIIVIRLDKRPVAVAFLLGNGDMLEIPWASTLREANPLSINMLLYWEVLSHAINKDYAFFDFGRSTKDANTYRFKKQWGAEPVQHYWYYWVQEAQEIPKLKPDNPKFKLAINLWQRMPVFLTKLIGPFIVKNLP